MPPIKFTARKIDDAAKGSNQCAILPLYHRKKLSREAQHFDDASGGAIKAALALGDFSGKSGESCLLPGAGGAKRLLLVGCGDPATFDRAAAREFSRTLGKALKNLQARDGVLHISDLHPKDGSLPWLLECIARQLTSVCLLYTSDAADE